MLTAHAANREHELANRKAKKTQSLGAALLGIVLGIVFHRTSPTRHSVLALLLRLHADTTVHADTLAVDIVVFNNALSQVRNLVGSTQTLRV